MEFFLLFFFFSCTEVSTIFTDNNVNICSVHYARKFRARDTRINKSKTRAFLNSWYFNHRGNLEQTVGKFDWRNYAAPPRTKELWKFYTASVSTYGFTRLIYSFFFSLLQTQLLQKKKKKKNLAAMCVSLNFVVVTSRVSLLFNYSSLQMWTVNKVKQILH